MRLWSLHPKYLDSKGLVALWREALLAQAVLAGKTRGYTRHPQLNRFQQSQDPEQHLASYLRGVHAESVRRGFHFDATRIAREPAVTLLTVTRGQLEYEWTHLANKLSTRSPSRLAEFRDVVFLDPHPLFRVIEGDVAEWETVVTKA